MFRRRTISYQFFFFFACFLIHFLLAQRKMKICGSFIYMWIIYILSILQQFTKKKNFENKRASHISIDQQCKNGINNFRTNQYPNTSQHNHAFHSGITISVHRTMQLIQQVLISKDIIHLFIPQIGICGCQAFASSSGLLFHPNVD